MKSIRIFSISVLLLKAKAFIVGSNQAKAPETTAFVVHNRRIAAPDRNWRVIVSTPPKSTSRLLLEMKGAQSVSSPPPLSAGLYRKFAEHAWEELAATGFFEELSLPTGLESNQSPAKGMNSSVVQISTKAMTPSANYKNLVRYARVALIETITTSVIPGEEGDSINTKGIQVLNLVVIPSNETSLPVLGIDLVSLPGNRHLLLLDAQPMTSPNPFEDHWSEWHSNYVENNPNFPWGGDFPEPVQKYVSKYSLWTRLQSLDDGTDPVSVIQNDAWEAFVDHLDAYLDLLTNCNVHKIQGPNHQPGYLQYRRDNDPAKPMLNSLYGPEWTNQLLDEVLFPQH